MDATAYLQLTVLIFLLLLSAFFSSAETSLTTINKLRLRSLADEGNKRAARVLKIEEKHGKMLSAILIGNNVVNISASSLATTMTIRSFGSYFVGIATGLLTLVVLLFGEIIPKTWAMKSSEKIALRYAPIIQLLMIVLTPVIFLIDKISTFFLSLLHSDSGKGTESITESELRTYVDVSHEEGVIESDEKVIINNVFDFSDAVAREIMIPRIEMVTVPSDASYEDVLDIFKDSMYTRLPVYENNPDNIIGIINVKDLLLVSDSKSFRIKKIMREAYYTYELKKTADLLNEMRGAARNVAFVLNEYSATVGMITLEDLLEEIVGEIRDEYDADEEELIQSAGENAYLIKASMKLDDINNALDTDFDSEDYDSIGGIMIEHLDRLPEDDEVIFLDDNISLQAKGISQNHIEKVLITLPPEEKEEEDTENSDSSSND